MLPMRGLDWGLALWLPAYQTAGLAVGPLSVCPLGRIHNFTFTVCISRLRLDKP